MLRDNDHELHGSNTAFSRLPRRAPEVSPGKTRRGALGIKRVARGIWISLLATPGETSGAQGLSGNRAAFSLGPFFWRRKRKDLGRGSEHPHSNEPSRSETFYSVGYGQRPNPPYHTLTLTPSQRERELKGPSVERK
jgi:hypothetical protein